MLHFSQCVLFTFHSFATPFSHPIPGPTRERENFLARCAQFIKRNLLRMRIMQIALFRAKFKLRTTTNLFAGPPCGKQHPPPLPSGHPANLLRAHSCPDPSPLPFSFPFPFPFSFSFSHLHLPSPACPITICRSSITDSINEMK